MTIILSVPPKRRCTKCGREFPATLEFFHKQKTGKYGLSSRCKDCKKEYAKSDERRAYNRAYYLSHPEMKERQAEKARTPEGRARNIAYKSVYEKTPEAREKKKLRDKRKREKPGYTEKQTKRINRWRNTPEGQVSSKASAHARRARKKGSDTRYTAADIELQIKAQTDKRGRLRCWWCGKEIKPGEQQHIDHRIPLNRGGSNGPENIVISHGFCNMSKHDKTPGEFMNRLF